MAPRKFRLHNGQKGSALAVRVSPRAGRNEIVAIQDDGTVKIRLKAPPVEGRANQALIEYLAEVLRVPASRIEIVAGASSHNKLIAIIDLDTETVQKRIKDVIF